MVFYPEIKFKWKITCFKKMIATDSAGYIVNKFEHVQGTRGRCVVRLKLKSLNMLGGQSRGPVQGGGPGPRSCRVRPLRSDRMTDRHN